MKVMTRRNAVKIRIAITVMAASMLAACGPTIPVSTNVKPAGANVFFGVPSASALPSLPPLVIDRNPVETFPTPVEQPPLYVPSTAPVPTPDPCPALSPLAYPDREAAVVASRPPAAGTYPFRYTGTLTANPGTSSQSVQKLPVDGTRQITNISALGTVQDYSFDVVEAYNSVVTTTSYHVYPQGPTGQPPLPYGGTPAAGVYITKIETTDPSNPSNSSKFVPLTPGVEIFPFQAAAGATWQSAATDPSSSTTMVVGPTAANPQGTGTIVDKLRVNACGKPIDSWEATMSGTIEYATPGPNSSETFTLTVDMATQFGGLIVGDTYLENYTDVNGVNKQYLVQATINVVPANPPS
jgi:hypothetical protein